MGHSTVCIIFQHTLFYSIRHFLCIIAKFMPFYDTSFDISAITPSASSHKIRPPSVFRKFKMAMNIADKILNLCLPASEFGQDLHTLALTCHDLCSLWLRSNFYASQLKFIITVCPPNASQRKFCC